MKQKSRWLIFIVLLGCFLGCQKQDAHRQKSDFQTLMGVNTPMWKFIETHEDYENYYFYRDLYDKNKDRQFLSQKDVKIPKVAHFIWLGPNPFPKESIENVNSWVEKHPDWTFYFWSDRRRPLPNSKMQLRLVSSFDFKWLKTCYEDTDNYAEKSDVLRYELLYQEGGLYLDHDVKCFKNFTRFHMNYDLYCGLEPPHQPITSSSVTVCNNIIGSGAGHPVLKRCIELVLEKWIDVASAYPGEDKDSIIYRIAHRTFASFDEAVREKISQGSYHDIVFPAAYFNRINEHFALFAHHYYASTWFEDESKFEKNVRRRLVSISKKNNQILLFNGVILSANLFLLGCLAYQYRNIRRFMNKK